MAIKNTPQFQRPEGRVEFERSRNALRALLGDGAPDEIMSAVAKLDSDLDEGVFKVKAELLGSVLCWKPDDRVLSAWIYDQHCEFAEMTRRAADVFERRVGADDPRTVRLIALAFLHWGDAAKWVVGRRERYDYGWMHWLMRTAMDSHRHLEQCELRLDARGRTASIEGLFFRTLLLDRFAGGNLTRQQIEVLDAWIWEWMPALKGFHTWPGQPVLRADLDGKGGLRHGQRLEPGPVLYLPIAPLEQKRQAVIKEFHRGRIVPSLGVAADFRVEEHVAVLEQLRIVFEASQDEGVRVERRPTAGPLVEVWVGLSEILTRGLNAHGAMPGTGLSIKGPASLSDTQRIRQIQFLDEYESTRRMLRLIDVSATGYGFEVNEKESMGIGVGDLVGMRLSDEEPCVLGRVVRRVPGQVEGQVILGVLAISNSPQALTLARTQRQNRPDDEDIYIYVPGCDDSGAQDAFLVPEKILQEQTSHDTILGDDLFTIQFNRVRRKGRGWALAGFEILDAKRVSDPPRVEPQPVPAQQFKVGERTGAIPIPNFELVNKGGEDAYANAWDREVSRRML
jgi:hypothetical protein